MSFLRELHAWTLDKRDSITAMHTEQLGLQCTCYEQVQQGACVFAASDRTWPGCTNRKVFVDTYVFNAHEAPHMLCHRGTRGPRTEQSQPTLFVNPGGSD